MCEPTKREGNAGRADKEKGKKEDQKKKKREKKRRGAVNGQRLKATEGGKRLWRTEAKRRSPKSFTFD